MKNKTCLEIDAVSAKRIAIAAQGFHRPRPMGGKLIYDISAAYLEM